MLRGHEDKVRSVSFCPDGTRLASASDDKSIRIWGVSTGAGIATLLGHEGRVWTAVYNPDGTRLASGAEDNTVRIWDAATGEELAILRGHELAVRSAAFSRDGTRLASASDDQTVRLWDVTTGEELAVLRGHDKAIWSVAFNPDGSRLASASYDKTVRLWDAATGAEVSVLRGHEGDIWSVAFSPDGVCLASGAVDKTVRLWDVMAGKTLAVLRGHEGAVLSVSFSPDSARVASASFDKTVRFWDAMPYRTRCQERQELLAAAADARPIITALRQELGDASSIAQRLRNEASLSEPIRRAALNMVLRLENLPEPARDASGTGSDVRGPSIGDRIAARDERANSGFEPALSTVKTTGFGAGAATVLVKPAGLPGSMPSRAASREGMAPGHNPDPATIQEKPRRASLPRNTPPPKAKSDRLLTFPD